MEKYAKVYIPRQYQKQGRLSTFCLYEGIDLSNYQR